MAQHRIRPRSMTVAVALVALALLAGPAFAKPAAPKVTYIEGRTYVVQAKIGGVQLLGQGTLPQGLRKKATRAKPPAQALGSKKREIVIAYGRPKNDPFTKVYGMFTHYRNGLAPVRLNGEQIVLATFSEGGEAFGFGCKKGRLLTYYYSFVSETGERTRFELKKKKLVRLGNKQIGKLPKLKPSSCY